MISYIFYIVSLTTFISFFYYKKFKGTNYKYFLYFLLVPFITELQYKIVDIYYYGFKLFNTDIYYNLYSIINFIFFLQFYKLLSKNKRNKKIFSILTYLFIGFVLFDVFILKNSLSNALNIYTLIIGSIFLLITLILFLIEILNNEKIIFNIYKSFVFWISVGLLLFFIGIIPIMIFRDFLNYNSTYAIILVSLNVIMYGSFIIGMIKSDTKYNY